MKVALSFKHTGLLNRLYVNSRAFTLTRRNRIINSEIPSTMTGHRKMETPVLPTYSLPTEHEFASLTQYGGRHTVAMLLGDGVSPEILGFVKDIYKAMLVPVDFEEIAINKSSDEGTLKEAILAIKRNGVAIKGNLETLHNMKSKNLAIRSQLDIFAYVQRCYSFPGITTRHKNIDIAVIRENTEGEYSQLEHESVPGVVESLKIITRMKSERIAKFAFDYAVCTGRKKVVAVHKANIMKLGDGLFLDSCARIAKLYPKIEFDSMIIDNCCMQLVSKPNQFDVMVLPNLYGNIVGNLVAGLVGGAGVAAGMNLGTKLAIFEAGTRKSARSLAGKNTANPVALLLAAADLLDHLNIDDKAAILRHGIFEVISNQQIRTPDIGGSNSTLDVINAILINIRSQLEKH